LSKKSAQNKNEQKQRLLASRCSIPDLSNKKRITNVQKTQQNFKTLGQTSRAFLKFTMRFMDFIQPGLAKSNILPAV